MDSLLVTLCFSLFWGLWAAQIVQAALLSETVPLCKSNFGLETGFRSFPADKRNLQTMSYPDYTTDAIK